MKFDKPLYYRRDGTPYKGPNATLEWAKDFEETNRRVGYDKFENGIQVSTVWLGIDHNLWPNGRPLIFESMVFGPAHNEYWLGGRLHVSDREEMEMWRYSTEEEARLGHKMLCKKWGAYKSAEEVLKSK